MSKTIAAALAGACLALTIPTAWAKTHDGLAVTQAWSRPTPAGAPTAVGYLTITNHGHIPDRLIGASSSAARSVEIHQMSMTGGVMRMRPVAGGLAIGAGQTIALSPGGYHLMLIGPKRPFKAGEHVPVTLEFARAGKVMATLDVGSGPTAERGSMGSMAGMSRGKH